MQSMDQGAILWLKRTARKNFWRVYAWYELSDLIQDGYLQYYRILLNYPHITNRAHLMRLFQVTYINHIHNLARSRSRGIEQPMEEGVPDPIEFGTAKLAALTASAPDPIKAFLVLLTSDTGRKKLCATYRVRRGGYRETFNERLCRLLGLDPSTIDLPRMIQEYFHSSTA